MRAVRYHGPRQPLRLEEVPVHAPAAGEVLVRVTASGVCHTELHFTSGLLDLGIAPITMGHEVVGRIEAVGDGVAAARVGERVIVYYYVGCGACRHCRVGDEQLCVALRAEYGFVSDGGYADGIWTLVEDAWVIKSSAVMPDGLTGSATITVSPKGVDRYLMTGTERIVGDERDQDFEYTVVRPGPRPGNTPNK